MKVLFKNAKIYDGTGADAFLGKLLIENDRIFALGESLGAADADEVVDLQGKSLAPGFIDAHSHNDWFALKKDPLPYFEPLIRQGIATFVSGNCGISAVGFSKDTEHLEKIGGSLFGYRGDIKGVYGSAGEFFEAVDGAVPCNIAVLVGHCSARAGVCGYENRPLSQAEEEEMFSELEKSLREGAAGVSLGLMYEPGIYADIEELKKVAALCLKYDRPLAVHPRAESAVSMAYPQILGRSHLLRALDELVEIAGDSPLKLQYSHAIFVGRRTLKDHGEFLKIVGELRENGVDFMFDIYNEIKGVSVITVILPAWYQAMSEEERRRPLSRLKLAVLVKATSLLLGFGFDDIEIAYIGEGYEHYEGKTVHQLAKEYGKSDLEMYLQLCRESDFRGRVNMGPYTTQEIIHNFERNPLCLYMTDAWMEEHGVQNPAIYDCFPKFLRDSLLGLGDTMPATIRRMTGAAADRFALPERGYLKSGYYADLTVFDEEALRSAEPDKACSFGIEKLYVNGRLILDGRALLADEAKTAGRAIRVI